VRLLVPGSSDVPFVRNLTRIGYRDLLRAGARIWEWDGPMLHAKTIVADNRWTRIGSSNLNPSSLLGNWELDVLVDDRALADAMERQFRLDIARSREVTRRPVNAPRRISRVLPTALAVGAPEAPVPYRRTRRELRQRAALALRTVAANARRSIFGPATIILVVLAFLFLTLPKATSLVFGALCVWLAIGAAKEAFRRRADR
jgi:cardiolipin synthase